MEDEKEYSHEYVKHVFTEDEKKEIATDMAQKVTELKEHEDSKKAVMSDFNSKIDAAKAHINSSATKLNNGYEMKTVKCEVVRDYELKIIKYIRTDNGEVGKEKPMSSDDMQMKLHG